MSDEEQKVRPTESAAEPGRATESPNKDHKNLGYIMAVRGEVGEELARTKPTAFILLYVIARRARWRSGFNLDGIGPGEAMLGDHRAYGMSEKQYRSAKHFLAKHGFAAFKGTNKGTVATITSTNVFDINCERMGGQTGEQRADKRRTEGGQRATNKEGKEGEEGKEQRVSDGPERRPRSVEEVIAHGQIIGMTEQQCRDWYRDCEACNWFRGDGTPFDHWKRQAVIHRGELRSPRQKAFPAAGNHSELSPSVQAIRREKEVTRLEKELKEVVERMRVISGNYQGLQAWAEEDLKKHATLKQRKQELLTALTSANLAAAMTPSESCGRSCSK